MRSSTFWGQGLALSFVRAGPPCASTRRRPAPMSPAKASLWASVPRTVTLQTGCDARESVSVSPVSQVSKCRSEGGGCGRGWGRSRCVAQSRPRRGHGGAGFPRTSLLHGALVTQRLPTGKFLFVAALSAACFDERPCLLILLWLVLWAARCSCLLPVILPLAAPSCPPPPGTPGIHKGRSLGLLPPQRAGYLDGVRSGLVQRPHGKKDSLC